MNLNDLPDEVLCQIFDNLDLYELKPASLVCRRRSTLTFSGQRMDRVWLVQPNGGWELVLNTRRSYRYIRQRPCWFSEQFESLVRLLHTPKVNVRVLHIEWFVTFEQLRLLLLEAPELQRVSIDEIEDNCEMNGPFPVLANLKSLVLEDVSKEQFNILRRSMPNLQSLYMDCTDGFQLEAWKHLRGHLKLIHLSEVDETYLTSFLELTFPLLEDLSMDDDAELASGRSHEFFQRHPFLQRLSISMVISLEWVKSISRHCPELTYLHLFLEDPEEGYLESLVQLTKLKHLSLQGIAERKMFRRDFKQLESVALDVVPARVLLENLLEVAPRLNRLKISRAHHDLLQLQFICENFSYLQHLEVNVEKVTAADNSVRFDGLANLQELTFVGLSNIHYIHRNNVRCLTMRDSSIKDAELNQIPEKFPALKRLIISGCPFSSLAGVERLHELIPSCRIDYDDKRFYSVDNGTSN